MRTLNIIIDEWGGVKSDGFAGHAGEHNAAAISVEFEKFPEECQYFRMIFSSNDGQGTVVSAPIIAADQKLSYSIPKSITNLSGSVAWQLCGYRSEGGTLKNVIKSSVILLDFKRSLADTTSTVETELKNTVEEELSEVESFLENFEITTGTAKASDFGLSCQKSGKKYKIVLNTPNSELAVIQRKTQTDFSDSKFFGNKYYRSDKTNEYFTFERVGNIVAVTGTVYYDSHANRNHTEAGNETVVIYLPFKPSQLTYVAMGETTARIYRLNPVNSSLNLDTAPPEDVALRLCFTYVCEDE